jgi:hypothetical protein
MVTSAHEGMHRIFQERPEIISPVFKALGIPPPEKATVDVVTPDVTENKPLERRIDTLLRISPSDGEDFLLAVEAQGGKDPDKESTWPYYVAHLRAKYGLPVLLLVVCRDAATAEWAHGPFECGTGHWTTQRTTPLVAGPHNLPPITSPRDAERMPAMAAFSALAHARDPDIDAILDALVQGLRTHDEAEAVFVNDFLDVTLGNTPAGDKWRELMGFVTYFPGRGTVRETAYLEGQAAGQAEAILRLLDRRMLQVRPETRERITACTDLDTLTHWFDRAITATSENDLFTEDDKDAGEDH